MVSENNNGMNTVHKFILSVLAIFISCIAIGCLLTNEIFTVLIGIGIVIVIVCLLIGKIDKKYVWAVYGATFIFPFIGAALSGNDNNTKEDKNVISEQAITDKTSQKSETNNKNDELKESNSAKELSQKEKEIADAGYKKGSMYGIAGAGNENFSNMLDMADYVEGMEDKVNEVLEEMAGNEYDTEFNAPTNAQEEKQKKIYIKHFIKGMEAAMNTMGN